MSSQKPLDQGQGHSVTPVPELQRIWFTESIRLPLGRAVLKLAWRKQALSSFYVSKEHDFKSTHITQPSQAGPPCSLGRTVVHQLCISGRTCGALALRQALSWMLYPHSLVKCSHSAMCTAAAVTRPSHRRGHGGAERLSPSLAVLSPWTAGCPALGWQLYLCLLVSSPQLPVASKRLSSFLGSLKPIQFGGQEL